MSLLRSSHMPKATLELYLSYEAHSNLPLLPLQPLERPIYRSPFSVPRLVRPPQNPLRMVSIKLKRRLPQCLMVSSELAKRRKNLTRMRSPWKKMRTMHQWKRMTTIETSTNSAEPKPHLTVVNSHTLLPKCARKLARDVDLVDGSLEMPVQCEAAKLRFLGLCIKIQRRYM